MLSPAEVSDRDGEASSEVCANRLPRIVRELMRLLSGLETTGAWTRSFLRASSTSLSFSFGTVIGAIDVGRTMRKG